MNDANHTPENSILVIGSTGKTGRRVQALLAERGVSVRAGSRSAAPPFDWRAPEGWAACLEGVRAAYVTYAPDLAMPGATDDLRAFVAAAREAKLERIVLLSGRGEPEAQAAERIVAESGLAWTVVRASWFAQNFSEGAFRDMVLRGQMTLPVTDVPEPFVDVDDIAEVAVAALMGGHDGEIYEVTGPEALSFDQVAEALSEASGRKVDFVSVPHEAFMAGVREAGLPQDAVWMLDYLFSTVLDGRNANCTDGVQRALGRPPRSFGAYAQAAAAAGAWSAREEVVS